jgi:hypothetical protein
VPAQCISVGHRPQSMEHYSLSTSFTRTHFCCVFVHLMDMCLHCTDDVLFAKCTAVTDGSMWTSDIPAMQKMEISVTHQALMPFLSRGCSCFFVLTQEDKADHWQIGHVVDKSKIEFLHFPTGFDGGNWFTWVKGPRSNAHAFMRFFSTFAAALKFFASSTQGCVLNWRSVESLHSRSSCKLVNPEGQDFLKRVVGFKSDINVHQADPFDLITYSSGKSRCDLYGRKKKNPSISRGVNNPLHMLWKRLECLKLRLLMHHFCVNVGDVQCARESMGIPLRK